MAKKRTGSSRPLSPGPLMAKIGRYDRQIAKLLQERATLVGQAIGMDDPAVAPLFLPGGEEMYLRELVEQSRGPLAARALRAIFAELTSGCRQLLRPSRVAFLGPIYSYSHLAALHRFGQCVEFVPVGSISAVFEEVERGQTDFGLVPIENSTDGRIADTLEMFTRSPVRICGEVEMHIHHTLLGVCPRDEIKEVYSKPQALSQCRNWLARHLGAARPIEVTSTSTAAQLAKEKPGAAAIASMEAGVHYGLNVLAEKIEDNPGNTTRFALIAQHSARRTGRDKTALMFQLEHQPGTLSEALNLFKRNRLNLTWIESFPQQDASRHYLFFVELEGHETDARVRKAITLLQRRTLRLVVLGSFPVSSAFE